MSFFRKLASRHLDEVCEILACDVDVRRIELVLRFYPEDDIPCRYQGRLYLPLSNLLNSYAKAINKRYDRTGSLFRRRFYRELIEINNIEYGKI